mgnify:CR=1 FL=1
MIGIVASSQSRLVNFKLSKKAQSYFLDAITCYLGGIFLVILAGLFYSGGYKTGYFDVGYGLLSSWKWRITGSSTSFLDEFIFGFIITYIIIWLKRAYKNL